ncbi:MAG: hypothetical protein FJW30_25465, partial [Acidobacteria bacterium]|nr:hypothetical protein [Acidobacteriota bacterium]
MRVSKKARLQSWLRDKAPEEVTEAHFTGLLVDLAPVTESNLRRMLRDTGYPLQTIVRGVDQSSLHALRETLLALARAYEAGDRRAR